MNLRVSSLNQNGKFFNKYWQFSKSSHRRCSIKKAVLENFSKFTGKDLCESLVFNKLADLRQQLH